MLLPTPNAQPTRAPVIRAQYESAFSIGISDAVFPFGTLCRYAKIAATSLSGMTTAEYRGIRPRGLRSCMTTPS